MNRRDAALVARLDALPKEERLHALSGYPAQLIRLRRANELKRLFTSFGYMHRQFTEFGLSAVLDDLDGIIGCAPAGDLPAWRALRGACRLSGVALQRDPAQFAGQLLGRLLHPAFPLLAPLLEDARAEAQGAGVWPLSPALTQGNAPSARTLTAGTEVIVLAHVTEGQIVTGSKSGDVIIWALPLRADSRTLHLRCPGLSALCVTPDGKTIVAGNERGEVVSWEVRTGFQRRNSISSGTIRQLVVTADRRLLVLHGTAVTVLDPETLEARASFGAEVTNCIVALSDGRLLAGTHDGRIELRESQTGDDVALLGWHGPYRARRMSEAELMFRAMVQGKLSMLDGAGNLKAIDFEAPDFPGFTAADKAQFMDDIREDDPLRDEVSVLATDVNSARLVASGSANGELFLVDVATRKVVQRFHGHTDRITCCALSAVRQRLVSGASDGTVRVFDTETGMEVYSLEATRAKPSAVMFSGDSQIIVGYTDGRLQHWAVDEIGRGRDSGRARAAVVALAGTSRDLFAVSAAAATTWDVATRARLSDRTAPRDWGSVDSITPDGLRAVSTVENRAVIWDLRTGWMLRRITDDQRKTAPSQDGKAEEFVGVALTSDLRRMLSYSYTDTLHAITVNQSRLVLWDAQSGRAIKELDSAAGYVEQLMVSPDGRWGATLGSRSLESNAKRAEMRLWDLERGACVATLDEEASCAAFDHLSTVLWWITDNRVRRCAPTYPQPETVMTLDSGVWRLLALGHDGLAVAVHGDSDLAVLDLKGTRRIASLTLDGRIAATVVMSGWCAAGDDTGRVYFLGVPRRAAVAEEQAVPETSLPPRSIVRSSLERLDEAAELAAQGEPAAALDRLRSLAEDNDFSTEFQIALAGHLVRIGEHEAGSALLVRVVADRELPVTTRLNAIEALPLWPSGRALKMLAPQFDHALTESGAAADDAVFRELLERLVAAGDGSALKDAATGHRVPIARVAAAQALARVDRDEATRVLRAFALDESAGSTVRVLSLDGLRHLLPADQWLEAALPVLQTCSDSDRHREAMAVIALRVARVTVSTFDFANRGAAWYELGLLSTATEINNRALAIAAAGQWDVAADLLERGRRLFPESAHLHCNSAGALLRLKRYDDGVKAATQALRLDADYEKALNFRAYALAELREYELAVEDLNRALQLRPGEVANLRNRAHCLRALGRVDEADADLQEAKRRARPGDAPVGEPGSNFEASDRGPSTHDKPEETGAPETRARILAALRSAGMLETTIARLESFAMDVALPMLARTSAILALGEIGATATLQELSAVRSMDVELTVAAAAGALTSGGRSQERRFFRTRASRAESALREAILAVDVPRAVRLHATHALAPFLDPAEKAGLVNALSRALGRGEPPDGAVVALVLLKAVAEHGERKLLDSIAQNSRLHPWIREVASECIGGYFDRGDALALLERLRREEPHDAVLQRCIERGLVHYSQEADDGGDESDDAASGETEPENARELLLRVFAGTTSATEMRTAARDFPGLMTTGFRDFIELTIRSNVPERDQPAFVKRLEWLRAIPRDDGIVALEAFVDATNFKQMADAAERHPVLRSTPFRRFLPTVQFEYPLDPPLEVRLGWLDRLGPSAADVLRQGLSEDLVAGRGHEALDKLDRIEGFEPGPPQHLLRGSALLMAGEKERAIDELGRAIEHHPSAMAYEQRAKAYMMMGRVHEAIPDFNDALRLDPERRQALIGRGIAYSQLENYAAAVDDLTRAHALDPQDEFVAFGLASAHFAAGDRQKALATLDAIPQWSPAFAAQAHALRDGFRAVPAMNQDDATFDAFMLAGNAAEMHAAVRNHPALIDPGFVEQVEQRIARENDLAIRDDIRQRLDGLLAILQNPAQLALDALVEASDAPSMNQAVQKHPLLRDPGFMTEVERLRDSIGDPGVSKQLSQQLALLRHALGG